jgi:hypothetical protein
MKFNVRFSDGRRNYFEINDDGEDCDEDCE